jgi:uncharacterized protein YuzE
MAVLRKMADLVCPRMLPPTVYIHSDDEEDEPNSSNAIKAAATTSPTSPLLSDAANSTKCKTRPRYDSNTETAFVSLHESGPAAATTSPTSPLISEATNSTKRTTRARYDSNTETAFVSLHESGPDGHIVMKRNRSKGLLQRIMSLDSEVVCTPIRALWYNCTGHYCHPCCPHNSNVYAQ